jgi:tetratricopeptide (TPR) repeat protein
MAFTLFFIIVLLIYSNTFQASWHLDDYVNINNNPRIKIKNLQPATLYETFFSSRDGGLYLGKQLYRPAACLTLALNWYFGQDNVIGYHAVNVFLHLFTAYLLFLTILRLFCTPNLKGRYSQSEYFIALLAAILWAINPIQTQAVTYIVQRMASMAAMFYLLSIYFYLGGRLSEIRKNQILSYFCCGVSFLLAIGSKENAVTLPLALIVLDLIFFQDLARSKTRKVLVWGSVMGGGCVAVLSLILFYHGTFTSIFSQYSARYFTLAERLMTEPRVVIFYLSQIFYPIPSRLSITHDVDISTSLIQPWTTLPAILTIFLLIAAGILLLRKSPILSFSILFFFLNHLIESTVFPIELIFEHRNYLPSLFLFLPLSVGIKRLFDHYQKEKRGMYLICTYSMTIVLIALGMGTYIRNLAWSTEKTLWEDAQNKAPDMSRPYQNLAWGYYEKINQNDEALRFYEKALHLKGSNPVYKTILSLTNAANIYLKRQEYEKAIALCQRALDIYPDYIQAMKVLTFAYLKSGKWDEALESAELLYAKHYTNPRFIFILSFSLLKLNKYEEALDYLRKVVRVEPNNAKIHYNIGVALSKMQKYERAEFFLKTAARFAPNDIMTTFYLIENSFKAGDHAGVERYLDRLFQDHSIKAITTLAEGLDKDALKISFTPELLSPLIAGRVKAKTDELQQRTETLGGELLSEENASNGKI